MEPENKKNKKRIMIFKAHPLYTRPPLYSFVGESLRSLYPIMIIIQ